MTAFTNTCGDPSVRWEKEEPYERPYVEPRFANSDIKAELERFRSHIKTCKTNPRYSTEDRLQAIEITLCRVMEALSA